MRIARVLGLAALAAVVSACQSAPGPDAAEAQDKSAALRNMERVAIAAHRCWFASNDPAFRGYSFANELDSHSGRPRFLLVPRSDFGGRPLLVVQAEGPEGRMSAFGPLLEGVEGERISADIARWAAGSSQCAAEA